MPCYGNRVPAAPLQEWIEDQLDRPARTPLAAHALAQRLGITERALYRYRRALTAGVGGERPTTTFARARVEEMLDHAGVGFWEVYPDQIVEDLADDTGYCPRCCDEVPAIGGRCTACGAAVRDRRPAGSATRRGQGRHLTDAQIRAAHVLYERRALSLPKLGVLLYQALGYRTPKACQCALLRGFVALGLPRRDQATATRMANLTHGRCVGGGSHTAAYQRYWRARRAAEHPCEHPGCAYRARDGSRWCGVHAPGFDEIRAAHLQRAHELLAARPGPVTPALLSQALHLHHEHHWDTTRIARALIGQTTLSRTSYLASLLRAEMRARGAYLGPHPERAAATEAIAA